MKAVNARVRPTPENMALMIDVFAACIESGALPALNSPCHCMARWMVDDSGLRPKRKRTRLKHRKPKTYAA